MTVFAQDSQLVIPFVTVAGFKAHPTYLGLSNLRPGDSSSTDQDAELFNCLLMASGMVENFINQPIQAHVQTDSDRARIDRWGRLKLKAAHGPVRTVLSCSYGSSLSNLTTMTTPTCQVEEGTQVILQPGTGNYSWTGALQFGTPPTNVELFTQLNYVAGYANAVLTAAPTQGATSITVSNPTGIFPGDTLRIWEPGKEESVVVASSYTPVNVAPFTAGAIPLVSGLANGHSIGAGVTGFDHDLTQATIYMCVDGLQRWGTASSTWPMARVRSATAKRVEEASMWLQKAQALLLTYRRVR